MTDIDEIVKCDECGSRKIKFDEFRGERFCEECGLVLEEDLIEDTSSGREKSGDPQSVQTHSANKEGFVLGSEVGFRNVDGSIDNSKLGRSLRKWNTRTKLTSVEKNRLKGIVNINMLLSEFGVAEGLKQQAIWNYKKLHENNIMAGMSLEVRASAVTYYTFKDNGICRTIHEVCQKNSAHPRQVAKLARKIAAFFRKPWVLSQRNITQEVEKYCSQLGVHRTFTTSAIEISTIMNAMAEERFITANKGFLAACLYLTGRLLPNTSYRTQVEISDVCNITEVTLRNNLINLLKMVNMTREDINILTYDEFIEGVRNVWPSEE